MRASVQAGGRLDPPITRHAITYFHYFGNKARAGLVSSPWGRTVQ